MLVLVPQLTAAGGLCNKQLQGTAPSQPPQAADGHYGPTDCHPVVPQGLAVGSSCDALALGEQCRQLVVDFGIAWRRRAGAGSAGRQPAPLLQQLLLQSGMQAE